MRTSYPAVDEAVVAPSSLTARQTTPILPSSFCSPECRELPTYTIQLLLLYEPPLIFYRSRMQRSCRVSLRRSSVMYPKLHLHRELWKLSIMYIDLRHREPQSALHARLRGRREVIFGSLFEHNGQRSSGGPALPSLQDLFPRPVYISVSNSIWE
jgi:hypothetical protein